MDNRELCLKLIKAETFDEVISILKQAGFWDDEGAWRDYGNISVNFSSVGNQQSQAESALIEKLINSLSLMKLAFCGCMGKEPVVFQSGWK